MAPRKSSTGRSGSKRAREESETPVFEDGSAAADNDAPELNETVGRATSASPASKGRRSVRATSTTTTTTSTVVASDEVGEGEAQVPFDDLSALKPIRVRIGVAGGKFGYTDMEVTPTSQTVPTPTGNAKVLGWSGTFKGLKIALDEGDVYGAAMVNIFLPPVL